MTFMIRISRRITSLWRREDGATLTEFALAVPLFLLLFFGLIDFGRMLFHWVVAERALYEAARVAAVRPPVCTGVPLIHTQGPSNPRFGTLCSGAAGNCTNAGTQTCPGGADPTTTEIWGLMSSKLPIGTTAANLQFSYSFDPNLGFVGGPYTPMVTVELTNVNFQFIAPIAGLVTLMGGSSPVPSNWTLPMTGLSVSLPGEDLALGTAG